MKIENICSVCGGNGKPVSGLPCICGGTGTMLAELEGTRKYLIELEIALGYFVNLPPQCSKSYVEVHERIQGLGYISKNSLIEWANSIKDLNSEKLSAVGIDDFGDLCDLVPTMKEWMNRFYGSLK